MESLVLLLLVLTLHVARVDPALIPVRPTVELVSGHLRVFSYESIRLRCAIRDGYNSTWNHVLWFRDMQQLPQTGDILYLRGVSVKAEGKYTCQGMKEKELDNLYTEFSLPVEVQVDGGWAILHGPRSPSLEGKPLELTCSVRDNRRVQEVILYKNGVEVMRNGPLKQRFLLPNATLADSGQYSCRASWDISWQTHSVISTPTYVEVLEILTQPFLEMSPDNPVKLICHVRFNAPDPAPSVQYYFYRGQSQLAPASFKSHILVKRVPGQYSCKARVHQLDLIRTSPTRKL